MTIAIAQQKPRSAIPRKRFGYLTRKPARGRMLCSIEADNLPAVVNQDEHHEQQPECRRRHDEHVNRSDAERFGAQEAAPGRRWRLRPAHHVLGDGRLTDLDAELEQLAVNTRRTPERISEAQLADQCASLTTYWPSPWPRPPQPVEPKALPMPLDY